MTGAGNTRQSLVFRLQQQVGLWKSLTDLTEGSDTGPSGKTPITPSGFGACPISMPATMAGWEDSLPHGQLEESYLGWVLHIAELEFESPPYQSYQPGTRAPGNQAALIQEEVNALVKKEAIIRIPREEARERFFSTLFLVPKKEGQFRLVINSRPLNRFLRYDHFKMEGIHLLRDLLQEGTGCTG